MQVLYRHAGIGGRNGLSPAFEAVDNGNPDILTAAANEVIEDLEPEIRAFGLLTHRRQHIALNVCLDA